MSGTISGKVLGRAPCVRRRYLGLDLVGLK